MARPRTCSQCQIATEVEKGYNFDGDGNLLCSACGKVLYPVTEAAETDLDKGLKVSTQALSGYQAHSGGYDAWSNQNSCRPATGTSYTGASGASGASYAGKPVPPVTPAVPGVSAPFSQGDGIG